MPKRIKELFKLTGNPNSNSRGEIIYIQYVIIDHFLFKSNPIAVNNNKLNGTRRNKTYSNIREGLKVLRVCKIKLPTLYNEHAN